jgi:hypothetical protein
MRGVPKAEERSDEAGMLSCAKDMAIKQELLIF